MVQDNATSGPTSPIPGLPVDVMQRAARAVGADAVFFDALLSDPQAAMQARFGVTVPNGLRLVRSGRGITLTQHGVARLAWKPAGELSDDDLELAAGGAEATPLKGVM